MPGSTSSNRPEKRSDSPDSRTVSPYIPYRSSIAASYSPFGHGSPRWSTARRANFTCTLSKVTWAIGTLIFFLIFVSIYNATFHPFVRLCTPMAIHSHHPSSIAHNLYRLLPQPASANFTMSNTTRPISPTSPSNLPNQSSTAFQTSSTHLLPTNIATPATSPH